MPVHRKRRGPTRVGIGLSLLAAGLTAGIAALAMQDSQVPQSVSSVAELRSPAPAPVALSTVAPPMTTEQATTAPTGETLTTPPAVLASPMNVTS